MLRRINEEDVQVKQLDVETENQLNQTACASAVNNLIQQSWDYISNINSVIATLEYNYKGSQMDNIRQILNDIIDNATINIGMLHKVTELVNQDLTDLLVDGKEKAEEIIDDSVEEK